MKANQQNIYSLSLPHLTSSLCSIQPSSLISYQFSVSTFKTLNAAHWLFSWMDDLGRKISKPCFIRTLLTFRNCITNGKGRINNCKKFETCEVSVHFKECENFVCFFPPKRLHPSMSIPQPGRLFLSAGAKQRVTGNVGYVLMLSMS